MASVIARGHVSTATTTMTTTTVFDIEALLQLIGRSRYAALVNNVVDIHVMITELRVAKTRYSLTSITWLYLWLSYKTHKSRVFLSLLLFFFLSWLLPTVRCLTGWLDSVLKPGCYSGKEVEGTRRKAKFGFELTPGAFLTFFERYSLPNLLLESPRYIAYVKF